MSVNSFFPVVTTTRRAKEADRLSALAFIEKYGGSFQARNDRSLDHLFLECPEFQDVIVFEEELPVLFRRGNSLPFRFHLNMAAIRLNQLEKNNKDRLIDVAGISKGMTVLDGTLGLGSDTLVISWQVGEAGKVIALEKSEAIYAVMNESLKKLIKKENEYSFLLKRVEIIHASLEEYVKEKEDSSFDMVYLDPMFDKPRKKSDGIEGLRPWATEEIPTPEVIGECLRVSKNQVVIKEPKASRWWQEGKCFFKNQLTGQRYQSVRYRILEKVTS